MLNPAYKLQYFRKAGWPEDWIEEARRLLTEKWDTKYKRVEVEAADSASAAAPGGSTSRSGGWQGRRSAAAASVRLASTSSTHVSPN